MVYFIIATILLVVASAYIFAQCENGALAYLSIVAIGLATCCLIAGIDEMNNRPKPLDVYQGKTTLEITYKDGIPIDSVVVFKNKM